MEEGNVSSGQLSFLHQQVYVIQMNAVVVTEVIVILATALFFTFMSGIMFFILWSKPKFREDSRYILFAHMLINDSVHLMGTILLYLFALASLYMSKAICSILILISAVTYNNTPLNLAVISLERYVAIRFPLRHTEIATQRRTAIAIGIMWFISSFNILIEIFYIMALDPHFFSAPIFCMREQMLIEEWQLTLYSAASFLFLVVVALTILYIYVSITLVAKSASTNKDSANKARKTVLLHMIQLGLCITSLLFALFESLIAKTATALYVPLQFLNFFCLLVLPRCLSPLIYGLRDNAIRPLFLRYFRCNPTTLK
ncbi:odorant receptor 131-2-like [Conger conger]|uniref:odorant receptor 131-2-like n=1 Tax=Conger conger TaxID=82655 RepID=UPI002A59DDF4|nr:odorant receptor 131-2-like [Conger conger]